MKKLSMVPYAVCRCNIDLRRLPDSPTRCLDCPARPLKRLNRKIFPAHRVVGKKWIDSCQVVLPPAHVFLWLVPKPPTFLLAHPSEKPSRKPLARTGRFFLAEDPEIECVPPGNGSWHSLGYLSVHEHSLASDVAARPAWPPERLPTPHVSW